MNNDNLFAKFNSIEDLPVSEELLGAYAEGNLRGAEYREVQNIISNDANLSELMGSVEQDSLFSETDLFNTFDNSMGAINGDDYLHIDVEELELPSFTPDFLIDATPLCSDIILGATFDDIAGHGQDDINSQSPLDCDSNDNDSFHHDGMNDNLDF